ncbi:MAG: hypothetical protein O2798_07595, partial [Chloroflexi bacterium]|nr:hypothetical protein [Chloroflexota bacterium]
MSIHLTAEHTGSAILVEPRRVAPGDPLDVVVRPMLAGEAELFLVEHAGRRYLLDRADIDRVSPSPASSLARYETAERIARLRVRHALAAPARELPEGVTPTEVACAVAEAGWRPVLVRHGHGWLAA